ncbi:hypothetical protein B0H19DRAFT_1069872 [Mycena capillaripes]|nr:hypothetical protein B0H19DRAFT_1086565 [Mycena capillaripes]KAJ6560192.1 hypothetical protein B0H19DRAFT_1069872 [Mycena capillaripes]
MYGAVQTGSITSVTAILVVITFVAYPLANISLAFGFFLGRVYGCTLLLNLSTKRMGGRARPTKAPLKSDEHFSEAPTAQLASTLCVVSRIKLPAEYAVNFKT